MDEVVITFHDKPDEDNDYELDGDTVLYRVRCEMEQWQRFRKFLLKYSVIHLVVFETPRNENPHIHALIESDKSEDAIKRARTRYFKEHEDMKGNGVASISVCERHKEYMEYLCKGRYAVKDGGVYRKADKPNDNKIEVLEFTKTYDYQQNFNDFWARHKKPITKTQQKKRMNFTEELCKEVEKTFGFVDYRYIDNYSREILKCSEDEYTKGWYFSENVAEISDLKAKYKQMTVSIITKWLIDVFCYRCKIFDDYVISRYLNLIVAKYRHHFAHTLYDQKMRVKNIMMKAGYNELMDDQCFEESDVFGQKEVEEYDEEKHGTGLNVFFKSAIL